MKKINKIMLLVFLFSSISFAQSFELIGLPGGGAILVIHPADPSIIYTRNFLGGFFKTKNCGASLEPIFTEFGGSGLYPLALPYNEIDFVYAAFSSDFYMRSADGGCNWSNIFDNDGYNTFVYCFNPLNSDIMFIIAKDKEIWRSNNKGDTWFKIKTFSGEIIADIAIAPSDTSIMYAAAIDAHIYKSTNSGNDWFVTYYDSSLYYVRDIEVNPVNENSVYLRVGGGLFKSIDGGFSFNIINPIVGGDIHNFTLDPVDTLTIYAESVKVYGLDSRLLKTTDGGLNWFEINNGFPVPHLTDEVVINPSNHEEIFLVNGVYKSTNDGNNWSDNANLCYTPVHDLYIDPEYPEILFASHFGGFQLSDDGGSSWLLAQFDSAAYGLPQCYGFDFNPADRNTGFLAGGYYDGLYKTTNQGMNWIKLNLFEGAHDVKYHPLIPDIIFVQGQLDIVSPPFLYRSSDGGNTWTPVDYGYNNLPIFGFQFHPTNEDTMYTVVYNRGILKSNDAGINWTTYNNGLVYAEPGILSHITSLKINKMNPRILYCGQLNALSKSTDGGENWFQIDSSLKQLELILYPCILLDDRQSGRLYVGIKDGGQPFTPAYQNGGLYLTEDDGINWQKIYDGEVKSIFADSSSPRNIYLNTKFGLMRFTDTLTTSAKTLHPFYPTEYKLHQNYPNPFNSGTTIEYNLRAKSHVILNIYNILGRKIKTLVNQSQLSGHYTISLDGRNTEGKEVASGIYMYILQAGKYLNYRKMLLLK